MINWLGMMQELATIGRTRCQACSGWGHTHRYCETHSRVTQCAGGSAAKHILVNVRSQLKVMRSDALGMGRIQRLAQKRARVIVPKKRIAPR